MNKVLMTLFLLYTRFMGIISWIFNYLNGEYYTINALTYVGIVSNYIPGFLYNQDNIKISKITFSQSDNFETQLQLLLVMKLFGFTNYKKMKNIATKYNIEKVTIYYNNDEKVIDFVNDLEDGDDICLDTLSY